jgi:hypothetical protein
MTGINVRERAYHPYRLTHLRIINFFSLPKTSLSQIKNNGDVIARQRWEAGIACCVFPLQSVRPHIFVVCSRS